MQERKEKKKMNRSQASTNSFHTPLLRSMPGDGRRADGKRKSVDPCEMGLFVGTLEFRIYTVRNKGTMLYLTSLLLWYYQGHGFIIRTLGTTNEHLKL